MSSRLGDYQLTRRIGAGGMGQVWSAVKIGVGGVAMPCAVKVLHAEFAKTDEDRERFLNEARIAAQLDHGRIVKVNDVGEVGDKLFLVMDRVDGVDLRSFVSHFRDAGGQRLPLHVSVFIVGEILAALAYAHNRTIGGKSAAVIHHDVTPGNIMISSNGEVKLTDFGIARFAATAGWVSRPMGTLRYMAPEQLMGYFARPESDVYELGVILHELVEGKRFLGKCDPEIFRQRVLNGPPPAFEREDVPDWLSQLCLAMIATEAQDRPNSRAALRVILKNSPEYGAAGEEVRQLYEQIVGDGRSGFTEFLEAVRDDPSAPMILPGERRRTPEEGLEATAVDVGLTGEEEAAGGPAWWDSRARGATNAEPEEDDAASATIDKTELLPAMRDEAAPASEAATPSPARDVTPAPATPSPTEDVAPTPSPASAEPDSGPEVVAQPPTAAKAGIPKLVIAAGVGALLCLLAIPLVLFMGDSPSDDERAQVAAEATQEPKPGSEANDEPEASEPEPSAAAKEPTPVVTPALQEDSASTETSGDDGGETGGDPLEETEVVEPPPKDTESTTKKKTSTKKKQPAKPKIAVTFTLLGYDKGEVKVRRRVHAVNYYANVQLPVGSYKVQWRPKGESEWRSGGRLQVADIGKDAYSVALGDGKHVRKLIRRNK